VHALKQSALRPHHPPKPQPHRSNHQLLSTQPPSNTHPTRVTIRPAGKQSGEGWVTDTQSRKVQRSFSGSGADEDIVVASVRAYTTALNKMIGWMGMSHGAKQNGAERPAVGSMDVAVAIGSKA